MRLGRRVFAFFEIALELLDQVQDCWRVTMVVDNWQFFPSLVFAVAPHVAVFLPTFMVLLRGEKDLICRQILPLASFAVCSSYVLEGRPVTSRSALIPQISVHPKLKLHAMSLEVVSGRALISCRGPGV